MGGWEGLRSCNGLIRALSLKGADGQIEAPINIRIHGAKREQGGVRLERNVWRCMGV